MTTPTAPRTAAQAVAWLRDQSARGITGWNGLCLRASRTSYGLPGGTPDAAAWWRNCPPANRRPWSNNPPLGAAVYWRTSTPHDHIAISDGAGGVWGTDLPNRDRIGLVPIGEVRRRWGATEVGWADWLNGHLLPITLTPPPPGGGTGTNPGGTVSTNPTDIARAVWEFQLPTTAAGEQLRARTMLARGMDRAVWDHEIPNVYGDNVNLTARRVLRDVARATEGRGGVLLDAPAAGRTISDADADRIAQAVAGFLRPGDLPG